jgi:hypothetical protein
MTSRTPKPEINMEDVHLVSYPKSGRTWVRLLISKYLELTAHEKGNSLEDLAALCRANALPTIHLTHAGGGLRRPFQEDDPKSAQGFAGRKVVFVARNFEDTLVSAFHQAKFRLEFFDGDLAAYIRDETYGAKRFIRYLATWARVRKTCSAFTLVRYEDVHANAEASLKLILMACGIPAPDPVQIAAAVEFCKFENLQSMERNNAFKNKSLSARDTSKIETFKFRKGQIGGSKDALTEDDIAYLNSCMAEVTNPMLKRVGWAQNG